MKTVQYWRESNGHEYKATYDDAGTMVAFENVTTGRPIPFDTKTARKFKNGQIGFIFQKDESYDQS